MLLQNKLATNVYQVQVYYTIATFWNFGTVISLWR